MKKICVFTVLIAPEAIEMVSAYLWELEPSGIEEIENGLRLFFDFETAPASEDVTQYLEELKNNGTIADYQILTESFDNKNWNEEWEKNIKVIHVSDDIVIKPTFKEYSPVGKELVLTIDPKMSFGTGEHQTTKLMLIAIKKYVRLGDVVLDIGTGSGILAIGAVKLGAAHAIAFDNDDWCYENGLENCKLNNIGEEVEIRTCELKDIAESSFNLVLANIQKNILLNIAEMTADKCKKDAVLLLSGLLLDDVDEIIAKYEGAGFKKLEITNLNEWCMIAMRKV